MRNFCLAVISLSLCLVSVARAGESLDQTIQYLIDHIAHADATFVRNGDPHTPAEAVEHIKAKYQHFKGQIKTPEDFIRLSASKSLLSGKPYLIRPKDGKEERMDTWLKQALEDHRKNESAK